MILNICMKFQEDILNGFHVKHRHDSTARAVEGFFNFPPIPVGNKTEWKD